MKKILALMFALSALSGLSAQEVSEKQDLTLFDISFYDRSLDRRIVEGVDARIRQVFVNLGRFNVIGLTYRLDAVDVDDFLAKIREAKEADTYIPIRFQTGEAQFTEAEYNKLVNSFILVIPQINSYSSEVKGRNTEVNIETSFTVIDARTMSALKEVIVETSGSARTEAEARRDAINAISTRLEFEIRSIPQFQIKSGIIDVKLFEVSIELGKNMGIQVGDEYVLQAKSEVAGFENVEETGLLIVKDVQGEFSKATVIYGNPTLGDPVLELPRLGADIVPYVSIGMRTMLDKKTLTDEQATSQVFNLGLKAIGSRGFYAGRPYVALEYTQSDLGFLRFFFIPVNLWVGGEYTLYLGRITINPGIAIGGTGIYFLWDNSDDPVTFSHIGARADMNLSILFNRDMKLGATAGARFMLGIFPGSTSTKLNEFLGSYTMLTGGIEFTIKL